MPMTDTPSYSALDCATALARNGIPVLPIRTDKRPYTRNGVKDATADAQQIAAWAEQYPGCNWGMACGEPSGITVLDIDPRNGGRQALAHLTKPVQEGGWGPLPETVTARTGGEESGWHYWFRHPEGDWGRRIRNVSIVPGVDVKTTGGYVIIPGSKTHSFYHWVEGLVFGRVGMAPFPGWVAKMASSSGQDFERDETGKIPVGQRNDFLHSLAGTIRRRDIPEAAIYEALVGMGKVMCDYTPDKDAEYRKVAASAAKYEATDPALKDMDVDPDARIEARRSERAVLGRVLDTGDRDDPVVQRAMADLRESYFDEPHGRAAFQKIRHIWQSGATPSLENVIAALETDGYEIPEGYTDALRREAGRIYFEGDVAFHIDLMRQGYMFREGSRVVGDSLVRLRESRGDAKTVVSAAGSRLMSLVEEGSETQLLHSTDLALMAGDVYDKAQAGELVLNSPTGWDSLDKEIIGLANGEITIVAARPGMLKTAFTMQLTRQMAGRWRDEGKSKAALFVSAEMSGQQVALRFMCSEAEVNSKGVRTGSLTKGAEAAFKEGRERFSGLPLYVDEMSAPSPEAIAARAHSIHAHTQVGLIVVDYIELLSPSEKLDPRAISNPVIVISEAIKALKALAKTLGCPVVIISQLSRDVEKRANKDTEPIPRPSDLRWAAMAEQTANQILMLYYPWGFWKNGLKVCYPQEPDKNHFEVHVQKNRDGEVGAVLLEAHKQIGKIVDIGTGYAPPSWTVAADGSLQEAEDQPSFMTEHYPEIHDAPFLPDPPKGKPAPVAAVAEDDVDPESGEFGWD
jgi:replicative DNA helicase